MPQQFLASAAIEGMPIDQTQSLDVHHQSCSSRTDNILFGEQRINARSCNSARLQLQTRSGSVVRQKQSGQCDRRDHRISAATHCAQRLPAVNPGNPSRHKWLHQACPCFSKRPTPAPCRTARSVTFRKNAAMDFEQQLQRPDPGMPNSASYHHRCPIGERCSRASVSARSDGFRRIRNRSESCMATSDPAGHRWHRTVNELYFMAIIPVQVVGRSYIKEHAPRETWRTSPRLPLRRCPTEIALSISCDAVRTAYLRSDGVSERAAPVT